MSGGLIVMFVLWVVIGALTGWLAPLLLKSRPPYGLLVDIVVSVVVMILVGLGDWFIIPAMFPTWGGSSIVFLAALAEPFLSVLVVLWLMRWWKRRR